jgi:hypothetical protein
MGGGSGHQVIKIVEIYIDRFRKLRKSDLQMLESLCLGVGQMGYT